MKCERCGRLAHGLELHDFCRACSQNLCEDCMREGCCGVVPAASGDAEDHHEHDEDKA